MALPHPGRGRVRADAFPGIKTDEGKILLSDTEAETRIKELIVEKAFANDKTKTSIQKEIDRVAAYFGFNDVGSIEEEADVRAAINEKRLHQQGTMPARDGLYGDNLYGLDSDNQFAAPLPHSLNDYHYHRYGSFNELTHYNGLEAEYYAALMVSAVLFLFIICVCGCCIGAIGYWFIKKISKNNVGRPKLKRKVYDEINKV